MFPVILTLGPVSVFSYGLMIALAAVICYFLMTREAKRAGMDVDRVGDLIFWPLAGGILGARLLYVLMNAGFFWENPLEIVMVQHGGLAWQGGLMGGFIAGFVYARIRRLAILATLDFVAPYIALGQAIGRIGCFLNGCCHGRESAHGLYFPVHHAQLIPIQLYASLALLGIFFVLKYAQRLPWRHGQIFSFYLVLVALKRFVIQFYRADYFPLWNGLGLFHLICLAIFAIGLLLNLWLMKAAFRKKQNH